MAANVKPVTVTVAFVTDGAEGIATAPVTGDVIVIHNGTTYLHRDVINAAVQAWEKLNAD